MQDPPYRIYVHEFFHNTYGETSDVEYQNNVIYYQNKSYSVDDFMKKYISDWKQKIPEYEKSSTQKELLKSKTFSLAKYVRNHRDYELLEVYQQPKKQKIIENSMHPDVYIQTLASVVQEEEKQLQEENRRKEEDKLRKEEEKRIEDERLYKEEVKKINDAMMQIEEDARRREEEERASQQRILFEEQQAKKLKEEKELQEKKLQEEAERQRKIQETLEAEKKRRHEENEKRLEENKRRETENWKKMEEERIRKNIEYQESIQKEHDKKLRIQQEKRERLLYFKGTYRYESYDNIPHLLWDDITLHMTLITDQGTYVVMSNCSHYPNGSFGYTVRNTVTNTVHSMYGYLNTPEWYLDQVRLMYMQIL